MLTKRDVLRSALAAREDAVLMYQINIDNYSRAIKRIDALGDAERAELAEFREKLVTLLSSERLEQKKEAIMRDVIAEQLEGQQ